MVMSESAILPPRAKFAIYDGEKDPILSQGEIIVETELLLRLDDGPLGNHIPIGNNVGFEVHESNFKVYYLARQISGHVFMSRNYSPANLRSKTRRLYRSLRRKSSWRLRRKLYWKLRL